MTVLAILQYPHPGLSLVARPILEEEFGTDALFQAGWDLTQTLLHHNGLGLASTQVGIPYAMFAIRAGDEGAAVFCNPEIVMRHKETLVAMEGCLSMPGVGEMLHAPRRIVARYRDTSGAEHENVIDDVWARVFTHEYDHLQGKTIVQRMGTMRRRLFLKELAIVRARESV